MGGDPIPLNEARRRKAQRHKQASPARPTDPDRQVIRIEEGRLEQMVDAAETALIRADRGVFQRGNRLVQIGRAEVITTDRKRISTPQIFAIEEGRLAEVLMSSVGFEKYNSRSRAYVPADAPPAVVKALLQRRGHFKLPVLAGVVSSPTMRDDGSLITTPGYDASTGLLYDPAGVSFPSIPENPEHQDAVDALALLGGLINTFPFVGPADRAVALSAILTGCVRRSLRTAPLHAFSAPVAGSGKSKLVDIASVIATGEEAGVIALGKTDEETEKRLASLMMSGSSIAIDNAEVGVGGDLLCQMLTQTSVRVRALGRSETPSIPTNVLVTATGNNIRLVGDMTRRAVLCRLDPKVERPELREFAYEPVEEAKRRRGELLVAALTVLRAFHLAGRPSSAKRLGSFEDWSDFIRGALLWLDEADPVDTIEQARTADPELENLQAVLVQWGEAIGSRQVSAADAAKIASERPVGFDGGGKPDFKRPEFREAIMSVAGSRGFIDPKRLGVWLARNKDRVIDGLSFAEGPVVHGIRRWVLAGLPMNDRPHLNGFDAEGFHADLL